MLFITAHANEFCLKEQRTRTSIAYKNIGKVIGGVPQFWHGKMSTGYTLISRFFSSKKNSRLSLLAQVTLTYSNSIQLYYKIIGKNDKFYHIMYFMY